MKKSSDKVTATVFGIEFSTALEKAVKQFMLTESGPICIPGQAQFRMTRQEWMERWTEWFNTKYIPKE